jgi:hypothetical protein
MTSGNRSEISRSFHFPPPSVVILSNLANELLLDQHFYLAVLNLAKELGHSAVYERKVILNPCNLSVSNKYCSLNNLESLGGSFVWKPSCDQDKEDSDGEKEICITPSDRGSLTKPEKNIWTKSRKAAYRQKTGIWCSDKILPKTKSKNLKRVVKINISQNRNNLLGYTSCSTSTDDISNKEPKVISTTIRSQKINHFPSLSSQLEQQECRVKNADQDLFPIFKNYAEGLPKNKIYVKNLSKSVSCSDLHNLFSKFVVQHEKDSTFNIRFFDRGKLRRQAFVTFANIDMATNACRNTHGLMLKGKPLYVVFAHSSAE